jgi:Nif-specific regulatory protein
MLGRRLKVKDNTLSVLMSCDFPGNVRELFNCLTRAAIASERGVIKAHHLSCMGSGICRSYLIRQASVKVEKTKEEERERLPKDEKTRILEALEKVGYVQAKAARLLGMTVRQLNYRIKKYGIDIKKI